MRIKLQELPAAGPARIEALRRLPRAALWVIAARLKTLSLSVMPVLAGTWIAATRHTWRADVLIGALIAAVAIQVGTNLWNDAADAARGVDTQERLGPPRLTALGLLDGGAVRKAAAAAFLTAAASGLFLVAIGGYPILLIGVLSLLMGYLYSMGPWPLSTTPFGELLVVVFFGTVAVSGTAFLHTGAADGDAMGLGTVLGLPAAAVLLVNNHRDRRTDARAGRRTLAILLGERATRLLYGMLVTGAVLGTAVWTGRGCGISSLYAAPALLFSFALTWQIFATPVSAGLNRLLPRTALLQIVLLATLAAVQLSCGG